MVKLPRRSGRPGRPQRPVRLFFDARYIRTDFHDGISRFSAELARAVYELAPMAGVDVIYLIGDAAQRELLPAGARVLRIHTPTSPLEPFTALRLNRFRPDVVFSPMQTIGSWGRTFKLILTLHDTIYYRHRTPPHDLPALVRLGWRIFHLSYMPQRWVLNGADVVATVSETSKRQFAEVRLTKRPVLVLANAPQRLAELLPHREPPHREPPQAEVSQAEVSQAEALSAETSHLDRLGSRVDAPPRNIIYMGSFMPYKNVETLIRGMAGLPDHTLHLLSRVAPQRRRELEALAPADASIVFHEGVTDAEYAQLLDDRAVLATLSLDEGYGLPIAEALAFGVPAVVSDLEIFREVAGEGALFVPAQNPQAFAAAVRSLDDASLRARIITAGRRHMEEYSWEKSARLLLGTVNELRAT